MKRILVSMLVIFLTGSCDNRKMMKTEREKEPTIYSTPSDDGEMNHAIAHAKGTLDEFDKAFRSNKFDSGTFALKVEFPTETGSEHIWATSIRIENGSYYGIVDNLPNSTTQVKPGEKIKLDIKNISDWMYADNGVLRGGYTIRLIRSRMTKEEKKDFDASFSFKIEN